MAVIERNRKIRLSTRLEKSTSYKIDTEKVCAEDTLIVNVWPEEAAKKIASYVFDGKQIYGKKSIHFKFVDGKISWSGVKPQKCY